MALMRHAMLSGPDLDGAVFIAGMDGVLTEYDTFTKLNPNATALALYTPGGAARQLAQRSSMTFHLEEDRLNYSKIFRDAFAL